MRTESAGTANSIGAEGASALAKALPACAQLASLDMDSNGIGTEGAAALAKALPECAQLASLDVGGNGIDFEGKAALRAAAAAVGPRLKLKLW